MTLGLLGKLASSLGRKDPSAKGWGAPLILDHGEIGDIGFAMDRHGRGQALWENSGSLWTQTLGPGAAASYGRLPMGAGTSPRVAMNLEGRGVAAWIREGSADRGIVSLPFDPGNGRGSSRTIFDTFGQVDELQVAVDRRGGALLLWSHAIDGGWEILAKHFNLRAKSWDESPAQLGARVAHPQQPRLAMNRRGQAVVAWREEGDRADGLVAAFHLPSEKLWSDHPVPLVQGRTLDHQIAIDHSGNVMALWVKEDYGQRSALQARLYSAERTEWCAVETLATAQHFRQLRLAMTGTGEALALWLQSEGSALSFLHSKAYRGGRWEERVTRLDGEGGRVEDFGMALGPKGAASLLFLLQRQEGQLPLVRDRGRGWEAPQPIARRTDARLSRPHLAICPEGAVALWSAGSGKETRLLCAERG